MLASSPRLAPGKVLTGMVRLESRSTPHAIALNDPAGLEEFAKSL